MFKRITVAYSESPEASRALTSAVLLAKTLGAELRAVTILQEPPAYTAYADAVDSSLKLIIKSDQMQAYERLHCQAREAALREGVELETHLLEGEEVDAIVQFSLVTKQTFSWSGFAITNCTYHVFGAPFIRLLRMLLAAFLGSTETRTEKSNMKTSLEDAITSETPSEFK